MKSLDNVSCEYGGISVADPYGRRERGQGLTVNRSVQRQGLRIGYHSTPSWQLQMFRKSVWVDWFIRFFRLPNTIPTNIRFFPASPSPFY
jgi:hypothetical protein